MLVRQAVLKGKDPFKLLEDMENIDKMGMMLLVYSFNMQLKFAYSLC